MRLKISKRIRTFKFVADKPSTSLLVVITLLILTLSGNSILSTSFNNAALAQQNPSSVSPINISSSFNSQTFTNQTNAGELVYKGKGKIVSQEVIVLDSLQQTGEDNNEIGIPKIKISYSGTGNILGVGNITETWTFVNTHRPDGIIQGRDNGAIITEDRNEVATAIELGRGHQLNNNITKEIGEKIVYPGLASLRPILLENWLSLMKL